MVKYDNIVLLDNCNMLCRFVHVMLSTESKAKVLAQEV